MGLDPDGWWDLTPRQFRLHVEGYLEAKERDMNTWQRLLAWVAANIMNSIPRFGKGRRKPVTVDSLLGKRKQTFSSAEEFHAHMRARIADADK